MDVDDVRSEGDKVGGVVHGILVEAAVLGLVELRLEPGGEQQDFQQLYNLLRGGTAQDCDADGLEVCASGKLAAEALSLEQEIVGGELIGMHKCFPQDYSSGAEEVPGGGRRQWASVGLRRRFIRWKGR